MSKIKKHILLVEDDPALGFVIQDQLQAAGYKVTLSRTGKEGLNSFNNASIDLCLLDVMLPEKDGFSLASDIRKVDQETPIIFLTARNMIEDKAMGFNSGGDDYLTKPFSQEELELRIKAVLKRTSKNLEAKRDVHVLGELEFHSSEFELKGKEESRKLTKKEAHILKILVENKGQLMERELILNLVWGKDDYFTGRSLDVFISKLRKYLKQDERIKIENMHGVGFKLSVDE